MDISVAYRHGGIVVYRGGILVKGSVDPADDGVRDGWVAQMCGPYGTVKPEPIGFGSTPSRAVVDLDEKIDLEMGLDLS